MRGTGSVGGIVQLRPTLAFTSQCVYAIVCVSERERERERRVIELRLKLLPRERAAARAHALKEPTCLSTTSARLPSLQCKD